MLRSLKRWIIRTVSEVTKEVMGEELTGERAAEIEALIRMNCGPRKTRMEKLLTAYKLFSV